MRNDRSHQLSKVCFKSFVNFFRDLDNFSSISGNRILGDLATVIRTKNNATWTNPEILVLFKQRRM